MDNNLTFLFSFSEKYFLSHKYRKIPKISPGAYILQRPFLRGLSSEGNLPLYSLIWPIWECAAGQGMGFYLSVLNREYNFV